MGSIYSKAKHQTIEPSEKHRLKQVKEFHQYPKEKFSKTQSKKFNISLHENICSTKDETIENMSSIYDYDTPKFHSNFNCSSDSQELDDDDSKKSGSFKVRNLGVNIIPFETFGSNFSMPFSKMSDLNTNYVKYREVQDEVMWEGNFNPTEIQQICEIQRKWGVGETETRSLKDLVMLLGYSNQIEIGK